MSENIQPVPPLRYKKYCFVCGHPVHGLARCNAPITMDLGKTRACECKGKPGFWTRLFGRM